MERTDAEIQTVTSLVALGEDLGSLALEGKVASAVLVTNGPEGLQVRWAGIDGCAAIGNLQVGVNMVMQMLLVNRGRA